jgi:hypothetical protein
MAQAGVPIAHARLLYSGWGLKYGGELEYLRTFVYRLRKKTGGASNLTPISNSQTDHSAEEDDAKDHSERNHARAHRARSPSLRRAVSLFR